MDDKEDLSLEHDWECDKKCNTCEMQELCEKLEEKEQERILEASKHMEAIMEIIEKYKGQQCLKNYINSYPDCIAV